MTDAKTIIKDWCATAGMPAPSDGECHALEVALQQQSGISGELPSIQDREDVLIEEILEACAEWSQYVEVDTAPRTLREHIQLVIAAARAAKGADRG